MKSGLEDRNNEVVGAILGINCIVSMKSGLEDRNNPLKLPTWSSTEDMSQ